jgi:hypothetical protein
MTRPVITLPKYTFLVNASFRGTSVQTDDPHVVITHSSFNGCDLSRMTWDQLSHNYLEDCILPGGARVETTTKIENKPRRTWTQTQLLQVTLNNRWRILPILVKVDL